MKRKPIACGHHDTAHDILFVLYLMDWPADQVRMYRHTQRVAY